MWIRMKPHTAIAIIALLSVSTATAADSRLQFWIQLNGGKEWQPPPGGVVRSARTAITIARALAVEENGAAVADEQSWQAKMRATLQDGVWEVMEPVPAGAIGGSCHFYISQADARFLGAYCTQ